MMETRSETLTLDYPVQLADRLLTEVTIRRPMMRDLRKYPIRGEQDIEGELQQFAALCNLRMEEIEQLDTADYARLQEIYLRFRTPAKQRADTGSGAEPMPADSVGAA